MENTNKQYAVSIIMPVYNTGKFLDDAVNSILNQSFGNFELILVDDGSTDGSSEKCDFFAFNDSRIKVIHQKNRGICAARNSALEIAKGDYVGFCDHDDIYKDDLIKKVYNRAVQCNADVIKFEKTEYTICNDKVINQWNTKFENFCYKDSGVIESIFILLNSRKLDCVWDAFFKKDFLKKNDFKFDCDFKYGGEDIDFVTKTLMKAQSFACLNENLYSHYLRLGISTSTKFHEEQIYLLDYQARKFTNNLKINNIPLGSYKNEYIKFVLFYLFNRASAVLANKKCLIKKKEKIQLLKKLKNIDFLPNWFFDNLFPRKLGLKLNVIYILYRYDFFYATILLNKIFIGIKKIRNLLRMI